ncbi:MAG: hypothetical protein H6R18_63 [Proteobacteria bacterium]|nr:hypothetical protein [Pseudomonadota bacterium]
MRLALVYRNSLPLLLSLALALGACSKSEEKSAPVPAPAQMSEVAKPPAKGKPMARMASQTNEELGAVSMRAADSAAAPAPSAPTVEKETGTSASKVAQLVSGTTTYVDGERKFIRTANATFTVKDVYVSALAIEDAVGAHGGFVVSNNITSDTQRHQRLPKGDGNVLELFEFTVSGNLIVRVPSAKTQDFLRAVANQIEFLQQRNFEARDVQFDLFRQHLERIRHQETQAELGQAVRDGGKLEYKAEVIAQRSDTKAARDEALIARKQLEDQISFSTIRFTLYQPARIRQTESKDLDAVFASNRPDFGTRLGHSLKYGWDGLMNCFIGLMRWWPLWLIIIAGVLVLRRICKCRKARRNSCACTTAPEPEKS